MREKNQEKDEEFRMSFGVLPPEPIILLFPSPQKGDLLALVANSVASITFSINTICPKQLIEMVAFPAPDINQKNRPFNLGQGEQAYKTFRCYRSRVRAV